MVVWIDVFDHFFFSGPPRMSRKRDVKGLFDINSLFVTCLSLLLFSILVLLDFN